MAEGTYEYECERAELLGIDPPNRTNWEEAERVRKENELAQQMTVITHFKMCFFLILNFLLIFVEF